MAKGKRGPRGGVTTTTAGGLRRMVVLVREDQYQELRRRAFEQECSHSELVRAAIDEFLEDE